MNGDGYPDLIVLSEGRLGWYPNNGDGTFGRRRSIAKDPIQLRGADISAADFDNDGDIDLVAVSRYTQNIVIYRNYGDNNFTAQTLPYSILKYTIFVALTDLNGDHLPDIIVSNKNYSDRLGWLKNLGNGRFAAPVWLLGSYNSPLSGPAVITDFDHDGDLDLIVYSDDGFQLVRNKGNGQFSSPVTIGWITNRYYGGSNELAPIYMAAADLNNDGLNDLVTTQIFFDPKSTSATNSSAGTVVWVKNSDDTLGYPNALSDTLLFEIDKPYITFSTSAQFNSVKTADINKDGNMDVVASAYGSNFISWYENDGNGSSWTKHMIDTAVGGPSGITLADLDNNGYTDVVATLQNTDQVVYYLNNGDGTFRSKKVLDGASNSNVSIVVSADMDGDGSNDVVTGIGGHNIIWYRNDGTGNFQGPIPIAHTKDLFTALKVTDLNGDQKPDILFWGNRIVDLGDSARRGGDMGWIPNLGGGTFGSPRMVEEKAPVFDLQTEDINGDGDVDLLALENGTIAWYPNNGNGTWSSAITILSNSQIVLNYPIFLGDLDNDRYPDLLYVTLEYDYSKSPPRTYTKIHVLKNNGSGSFTEKNSFAAPPYLSKIETIDVDKDGLPDLLMIPLRLDSLSWYHNTDSLTFEPGGNIGSDLFYHNTFVSDLDHDGYPDIITASGGQTSYPNINLPVGNDVGWYRNLGNGTFAPLREITNKADYPQAVFAADLNSDGLPDVLSASEHDDKLAWYPNMTGQIDLSNPAPLPPVLLTLKMDSVGLTLSWQSGDPSGISKYNIYRSTTPIDSSASWIDSHVPIDTVSAPVSVTNNVISFEDKTELADSTYYYRVTAISTTGKEGALSNQVQTSVDTGVEDTKSTLPKKFALHQNYPNPFNPTTTIAYDLPKPEHVILRVYNILGQRVYSLVDQQQAAGRYTVRFNATALASGLYFYRIQAGSFVVTKKLMLIK